MTSLAIEQRVVRLQVQCRASHCDLRFPATALTRYAEILVGVSVRVAGGIEPAATPRLCAAARVSAAGAPV